jgi:ADP-ribose pyrophosphatase
VLYEGHVGSYGLDEVELPSGVRVTLELLRHPRAAAVVPFLDEERIIMLYQYRYAANGEIWEVPAGKLEPGETPESCVARELEEETGYRARRVVRTGEILTSPGFTDERIHLFCAYDLEPGVKSHETAEVIQVHEVPFTQAIDMIARGEIIDAKSIAALHHAARLRGR